MSVQGRVVWHDLNTSDLEKSKRFYSELFGWRLESAGEWALIHAADEKDHFGAMMLPHAGTPSHWVPYFAVNDLDKVTAALPGAGGKLHLGKTPAGKTGEFAIAGDPQGAVFSAFQYTGGEPKPEQDTPPAPGHFCWDELLTADPDAAAKFYGSVLGLGTEHMEMPGMRYTLFLRDVKRTDGKPRQAAGMMKKPDMVPHTFWLSYVAVADCDQSMEKAKRLGATITSPPMEIPNVGRFSTLLDSTMAPIAILGPGGK